MELDETLALLARQPSAPVDVAEVALHLARDEFPTLDVDAHLSEINAMAREVQHYLGGDLAAQVHGLCRYLFHEMGFHGNPRNYYDPGNSYLNQVLERHTGIPISLSALTMSVGRRAGLDIVGVGLPGHFVVKALNAQQEILLDPFHGGRVLTARDCEILVQQATGQAFQATEATLQETPPGMMLARMLGNLRNIYLHGEDFSRAVRILERMRQLQPRDPGLRRDLGGCYLRLQKPGKAIDHLEAYLAAMPMAPDGEMIRENLRLARTMVAGWN